MPLVIVCDRCQNQVRLADKYAGKRIKCPRCQAVLQAPAEETLEEVEEARIVERAPAARDAGPRDWVDHRGDRLPKRLHFFVDPPPEIGPVLSAHSTLPRGKEPWPAVVKIPVAVGFTLIGAGLGVGLDLCAGVENWIWRIVWVGVGLGLGLLVGTGLEQFKHWLTYVGARGIARFTHTGNPAKIKREVVLFEDAADLCVKRTRHLDAIPDSEGRRNARTTYRFEWLDEGGKSLLVVSNWDHILDKVSPQANFFHFGNAAETAWTAYLLPEARRRLKAGEALRFRIHPLLLGDWVELGQAGLTFHFRKKTDEWTPDEIAEVECDRKKGVVRFRHVEAEEGWLSSKGVYEISFGDLANVELFLALLREFHGHPA
jgi:hypothetical protein